MNEGQLTPVSLRQILFMITGDPAQFQKNSEMVVSSGTGERVRTAAQILFTSIDVFHKAGKSFLMALLGLIFYLEFEQISDMLA